MDDTELRKLVREEIDRANRYTRDCQNISTGRFEIVLNKLSYLDHKLIETRRSAELAVWYGALVIIMLSLQNSKIDWPAIGWAINRAAVAVIGWLVVVVPALIFHLLAIIAVVLPVGLLSMALYKKVRRAKALPEYESERKEDEDLRTEE